MVLKMERIKKKNKKIKRWVRYKKILIQFLLLVSKENLWEVVYLDWGDHLKNKNYEQFMLSIIINILVNYIINYIDFKNLK